MAPAEKPKQLEGPSQQLLDEETSSCCRCWKTKPRSDLHAPLAAMAVPDLLLLPATAATVPSAARDPIPAANIAPGSSATVPEWLRVLTRCLPAPPDSDAPPPRAATPVPLDSAQDLPAHGSLTTVGPVKQGWLEKRAVSARYVKNYRRRLLVLWPDRVCWHRSRAEEAPAGELPLQRDTVVAMMEPGVLSVRSDGRTLVLRSRDPEEMRQWLTCFRACLSALVEAAQAPAALAPGTPAPAVPAPAAAQWLEALTLTPPLLATPAGEPPGALELDPWRGVSPLGVQGALPPEVEAHQLQQLRAAFALLETFGLPRDRLLRGADETMVAELARVQAAQQGAWRGASQRLGGEVTGPGATKYGGKEVRR